MMSGVGRWCGIRRAMGACLLAVVLVSLFLSAPEARSQVDEQAPDDGRGDATGVNPGQPSLGLYITSLRDFDVADYSFGADFWIWSVHPPKVDPLDDLEFVNAKQVEMRLDRTSERGARSWSRQKVRATMLHDWDLNNFPFDRQALQIDLRLAESGSLVYLPDEFESGYG